MSAEGAASNGAMATGSAVPNANSKKRTNEDADFKSQEPESKRSKVVTKEYRESRFSSKTFSLRVGTEGKRFLVHEDVLAISPVFGAMCKSHFREGQSQIILLEEDDPTIVRRLIDYLYGLRYETESTTLPEKIEELIDLFIYADKYQLEHLRGVIINHLFPELGDLPGQIEQLYSQAVRAYLNTTGDAHEQLRTWFTGLFDDALNSTGSSVVRLKSTSLVDLIDEGGQFAQDIMNVLWTSSAHYQTLSTKSIASFEQAKTRIANLAQELSIAKEELNKEKQKTSPTPLFGSPRNLRR